MKLVAGVGLNDADYPVHKFQSTWVNGKLHNKLLWRCPFYDRWVSLLKRCYDKPVREYYEGVTVCEDWLTFSNFKAWMESQNWEGSELDKDILKKGNRVYGPEFCSFVPREVNVALTHRKSNKGLWPVGVSYDKKQGKYASKMSVDGVVVSLGRFNTPENAFLCYKYWKETHLKFLAFKNKSVLRQDVYDSLMKWEIETDG